MDRMETIKGLLKQMNISEDVSSQFTNNLDAFVKETKENTQKQLQEQFDEKLTKIKRVCLEETRNYKAKLAKKLQVFLETKATAIESQIAKQVAIRESAAEADLQEVKAILEGYPVNAAGNVDVRAIESKLAAADKSIKSLTEARDQAISQANRAKKIAQTAIDRAKTLQESLAAKPVVVESTQPAKPAPKVGKQGSQPATTNTIAEESVAIRKPAKEAAPANEPQIPTQSMEMTPEAIAAAME